MRAFFGWASELAKQKHFFPSKFHPPQSDEKHVSLDTTTDTQSELGSGGRGKSGLPFKIQRVVEIFLFPNHYICHGRWQMATTHSVRSFCTAYFVNPILEHIHATFCWFRQHLDHSISTCVKIYIIRYSTKIYFLIVIIAYFMLLYIVFVYSFCLCFWFCLHMILFCFFASTSLERIKSVHLTPCVPM
jgi:hypothetical protein